MPVLDMHRFDRGYRLRERLFEFFVTKCGEGVAATQLDKLGHISGIAKKQNFTRKRPPKGAYTIA